MNKKVGRRILTLLMTITLIAGSIGGHGFLSQAAADVTISNAEVGFYADWTSRLDVVCVTNTTLAAVRETNNNKDFTLTSVDDESGCYINGVRTTGNVGFSAFGFYLDANAIKGLEYAAGDYLDIMGTFTETITNRTYQIDLHLHCTAGSGTGDSSTATWEFTDEAYEGDIVISRSNASLSVQRLDLVTFTNTELAAVYTKNSADFILTPVDDESGYYVNGVRTTKNVAYSRWGMYLDAVNNTKGTEYVAGDCLDIMGTFTEAVTNKTYQIDLHLRCTSGSGSGSTSTAAWEFTDEAYALKFTGSFRTIEETDAGYVLTMNSDPALGAEGTLGTAAVTILNADGTTNAAQNVSIKVGEVDSEVTLVLAKIDGLTAGMKAVIAPCEINQFLRLSNTVTLLWDGTEWTDKKNLTDIVGDANGDSEITVQDIVRYKKVLANKESFATDYVADLNKDGVTDEFDTTMMREIKLGMQIKNVAFDDEVNITSPEENETVYPYTDRAKAYLTTEGADINDYYVAASGGKDGSLKDVEISWEKEQTEKMSHADRYVVEYATKADFSDALKKTVKGDETSTGLNNLYKAQTYYVRVKAYAGTAVLGVTEPLTFQTTDIGPRVMTVDGIYNVRDLGGYMTESGKTTKQGLLYRGSEMDGLHSISLTEKGDEIMSGLMGIKYDMDFRSLAEANYATESPISSATKTHHVIGGYTDVFNMTYQKEVRSIFQDLADPDNYPIYFHCWGGADRTGTIAFLVNGLLGVSEAELIKDYEFTSYSNFGVRADDSTEYKFSEFLTQIKTYTGDTLSAKIENYLLSIGVTSDEIANIKAIMFGEETTEITEVPAEDLTDYWDTETGSASLTAAGTISSDEAVGYGKKVTINLQSQTATGKSGHLMAAIGSYGVELRGGEFRLYTLSSTGTWTEAKRGMGMSCPINFFDAADAALTMQVTMTDSAPILYLKAVSGSTTYEYYAAFPSRLAANEITSENAKVSFYIDGTETTSLTVKTGKLANLSSYWTTSDGTVVMNASNTQASSDQAVGYDRKVKINLQTVLSGSNGDLYITVGSYGVHLRGSRFRMATYTDSGAMAEVSPRVEQADASTNNMSTNVFKEDGGYLILETETVSDTQMKMTWKAVSGDGTTYSNSYVFTRIADEIVSENAKVTIKNTASEFSTVTIHVGSGS